MTASKMLPLVLQLLLLLVGCGTGELFFLSCCDVWIRFEKFFLEKNNEISTKNKTKQRFYYFFA